MTSKDIQSLNDQGLAYRGEGLNQPLVAAAVQFNPEHGEPERNRTRMAELLAEAARQGAKLVVFPEMASSGYVWQDREEISPYTETIPGPTTNALFAVTRRWGCYAVVGLPERDVNTGAFYNSAVLLGPEGIIGIYRKTHLFAADPRWAREGNDGIPVFKTPIGNIAMLICMDAMYFEPSRIAALQEADIVAFPTNWVGGGNNPPSKTWCLRAWENGVYWIAANRSDQERGAQFTGGSGIIGPEGEVQQALLSGEGIVYANLDVDSSSRRQRLGTRQPKAYQEILLQPYLWREGETRSIASSQAFDIGIVPYPVREGISYERLEAAFSTFSTQQQSKNSRLLILPELPYNPMLTSSDTILNGLEVISAACGSYIVVGLRDSNSSDSDSTSIFMIGPDGQLGHSFPVHVNTCLSDRGATQLRTYELPFGRVGVLAAQDASYPESYRVLAKQGADIIAVSCSGDEPAKAWMRKIWAFENDAILAAAAPEESEESVLFLHRQVLKEGAMLDGEAFMETFRLEQTLGVRGRPFMRRMKTHLYELLVL